MSRLILDTSALVAYAAGSIDVGEPVAEVHSEGGRVADAYRVLGRADLAAALIAATLVNGYVLTGEPDAYSPGGDAIVIGF